MQMKPKARVAPPTPGPIRVGSNTHRIMELVAKAAAESLAAGGKAAGDDGQQEAKPPRNGGSVHGH